MVQDSETGHCARLLTAKAPLVAGLWGDGMDEKTRRILKPEPDWLERASQPSELGLKAWALIIGTAMCFLLAAACAVAFVLR